MNDLSATAWVIDDDASIRWVLDKALRRAEIGVRSFTSAADVLRALSNARPDVIITDIRMSGMDGFELIDVLSEQVPDVPVIVITAHTDLDSAVASYQRGAFEYLPKPFDINEAVSLVKRAIDHQRNVSSHSMGDSPRPDGLIGEAPAMQEVFRAIGRLARSHVNVLICGESGTGKELVARALYENSPRHRAPFIAINTAAIPADLLESELFGHEKGAFTGAQSLRRGRFEQADGGTLFLDEIGDMPSVLQTRLLRVLSDGEFYRVGGHQQLKVDVRIIAATNQDLDQRVREERFREDLFHRLNVIRVTLPPLRDRREDIPVLARHFLARAAYELKVERKTLHTDAERNLCQCVWPGNVRQLENVCRWLTVMAPGQMVSIGDLPKDVRSVSSVTSPESAWERELRRSVDHSLVFGENDIVKRLGKSFERVLLEGTLQHTGGHKQEAAKRLGWGRNTITRKLKELGLDDTL